MLAVAGGLSLIGSGRLYAQALEKVTVSATVYGQGAISGTTYKTPNKTAVTTATLLGYLDKDEGSVPTGAKLGFNGTSFVLYNATTTNIVTSLTLQLSSPDLVSGSTNTPAVTPPFDQTTYQPATLYYSGSTTGLNFTVNGLAATETKATTPTSHGSKAGDFTLTGTFSFAGGTGSGTGTDGNPILLSEFTITANGSSPENTSDFDN